MYPLSYFDINDIKQKYILEFMNFSEVYRTPLFRFFLHTKLIPRIIDASDTGKGAGHPLQIWPGNRLLTGLFSGFCE